MSQSNQQRICAIIEARMTSSRLPGKVLLPLDGKPSLEVMVERLKHSQFLNGIIIATTNNRTDDPIALLAEKLNVPCFRGSEEDVLLRVVEAAEKNSIDIIVETTGDCPLIDHRIVDKVIDVYLQGEYDYVSNCVPHSYPVGMDVQVFTTKKLREIERLTSDPVNREHVSFYFYEKPGRFQIKNVESGFPKKIKNLRLTLDTIEDWQILDGITRGLYSKNPKFSLEDIVNFLEQHPTLAKLNSQIKQKTVR